MAEDQYKDPPVDEFGIPIKKKDYKQPTVDEFGIPIKKKETSLLGSKIGGQVGSSVPPLEGDKLASSPLSLVGKSLQKKKLVYEPDTNVEEYNTFMRGKLGLPQLNLGSDLPQIKRERESKEYQELRNIEENEVKPFEASLFTGTVQPSQIKDLANKPYGKKLVNDAVRQYAPEAGGLSLDESVFGSDKNAEQLANVLQQKFRQQGLDAQNKYLFNIDKEVYDNLKGLKRTDVKVSGGTGGAATSPSEVNFPSIDTNNPVELGKALEFLSGSDGTYFELNGKRLSQKEISDLSNKINEKLFFIKAGEPIHPEILSQELSGKLLNAVSNIDAEWKKNIGYSQEQKQQFIQKDFQYAEEGLNFLRDANKATYDNIVNGILKKEKIADADYEQLVSIGKRLESEKKFRGGEFLVDDSRDFRTYQTLKAEEAGALSEKIKQMGYKNKAKVADNVIVKAAIELGIDPNSQRILDIRRDEASGGYGIVKGGGITAFMRGLAQPVKSLQTTFQAIFDDPATTYLNSRRYDYGDQIIPDKEGNYTNVLPSERGYKNVGNIFNKILEGTGQLATQVFTSRLGGQLISAPYRAATMGVPRAALTASQATNVAAYGGGFLSTLGQTYGQSYVDFLNKTGNPNKASFMALVDATAQSVIEVGILPDVKLVESMKDIWQNAKRNLATDIMRVVERGGGKEAAQPFIKKFTQRATEIWGKEAFGEEGLQNLTNYLTEAFFSPKTAERRNLSKETINVIKDASLAMAAPIIIGGFAAGKANRKLTQDALHTAAQNFDAFADAIENGTKMGVIAPQDANTALEIIKVHKQSVDKAPKQDANGELINASRQLEYAFQNTVEEIAKSKLAKETDEIQQEPLKKQIEEAKEIKRKIFNGTEISTIPKEEKVEQPTIDQDRDLMDSEGELTEEQKLIQQAIDNKEISGVYLDMAKVAVNDPQQAKQLLDEAKSQATGQVAGELGNAREGVEKAFGKSIADFVAPSTGLSRGDVENKNVPLVNEKFTTTPTEPVSSVELPKEASDILKKAILDEQNIYGKKESKGAIQDKEDAKSLIKNRTSNKFDIDSKERLAKDLGLPVTYFDDVSFKDWVDINPASSKYDNYETQFNKLKDKYKSDIDAYASYKDPSLSSNTPSQAQPKADSGGVEDAANKEYEAKKKEVEQHNADIEKQKQKVIDEYNNEINEIRDKPTSSNNVIYHKENIPSNATLFSGKSNKTLNNEGSSSAFAIFDIHGNKAKVAYIGDVRNEYWFEGMASIENPVTETINNKSKIVTIEPGEAVMENGKWVIQKPIKILFTDSYADSLSTKAQPKAEAPTQSKATVREGEGRVSELEAERDAEIIKQGKPKVDIVGLKDEDFARLSATKQNEYEEWEKEEINLRKLIDCLWKK